MALSGHRGGHRSRIARGRQPNLYGGCVRDLDPDADVRNEAIPRPLVCSEAGVRRLAEGTYAEVPAALDLLAVEVVVTSGGE